MRRAGPIVALVSVLVILPPSAGGDAGWLIAHEWGTFTSVAGEDGEAVEWLPQAGPSDLPSFVLRTFTGEKGRLRGTIRMETPVIYFYTARERTVDVKVRFRHGVITEWFPRGTVATGVLRGDFLRRPGFEGTIAWKDVKIVPGDWTEFPIEDAPSHYYAARETDASPVQVGSQREKFLFYRGVAAFAPPVTARVMKDGAVTVKNRNGAPLGSLVLFENRRGAIRYEVRHSAGGEATLAASLPAGQLQSLFDELAGILIANGLYPKEARAMIATWRDSWFEEGLRLFYVVSPTAIDAILPLDVHPQPSEVARVFVGRVELITDTVLQEVRNALQTRDETALGKYGRFLFPILERLQ